MRGLQAGSMPGQRIGDAESDRAASEIDERKSWLKIDVQAHDQQQRHKANNGAKGFIAVNEDWW